MLKISSTLSVKNFLKYSNKKIPKKIKGTISENDIIKYKGNEIGKIMINEPYIFALVKIVDPDISEFNNSELISGNAKIKILKPDWV